MLADGLNDRQRAFCACYSVFGNGARAAREAGYSQKAARQGAVELLSNPNVRAEVDRLQKERLGRYEVTAANMQRRAAQFAFTDIAECFYPGTTTLKPLEEMSEDGRAILAGIEVGVTSGTRGRRGSIPTREPVVKIKTRDAIAALELLAKLTGTLKDAGELPPYNGPAFIFPAGVKVRIE